MKKNVCLVGTWTRNRTIEDQMTHVFVQSYETPCWNDSECLSFHTMLGFKHALERTYALLVSAQFSRGIFRMSAVEKTYQNCVCFKLLSSQGWSQDHTCKFTRTWKVDWNITWSLQLIFTRSEPSWLDIVPNLKLNNSVMLQNYYNNKTNILQKAGGNSPEVTLLLA